MNSKTNWKEIFKKKVALTNKGVNLFINPIEIIIGHSTTFKRESILKQNFREIIGYHTYILNCKWGGKKEVER